MVRMGGWRPWQTLAVVAALGLFAAAPLQAESGDAEATQASMLASLQPGKVSGGVYYAKLVNFDIYLLFDGQNSSPACVVIGNQADAGWNSKAVFQSVAERFKRLYKLNGYTLSYAADGSAAFLLRVPVPDYKYYYRFSPFNALTEKHVMELVNCLNCFCKGTPNRLEGSRLIWQLSGEFVPGAKESTIEFSVDMLAGVPTCLEIQAEGVKSGNLPGVLSNVFRKSIGSAPRNKVNIVQRKIGCRPLAYQEGRIAVGKKRRLVAICVVKRAGTEDGYRMALMDVLKRIHEQGWSEGVPPQVETVGWPDEVRPVAAPSPAPAPQTAGPQQDIDWPKEEPEQPSTEPAPAGKAMPSPEEARKAYSERLKAL